MRKKPSSMSSRLKDSAQTLLLNRLQQRKDSGLWRSLSLSKDRIDFTSNDYLGLARDSLSSEKSPGLAHGSTGSRLLSGNSELAETTEHEIARFHAAPTATVFNSGYDANVGLFSALLRETDRVFYDERIHASVHDGIRLGKAQSFPFRHNDLEHLEARLRPSEGLTFVATESLFSMDGDFAPLASLTELCEKYGALLIVDEAHATGVIGPKGAGLTQDRGLADRVFARVHTFGKALGCHGAAVLGSQILRDHLINFARPLIYSTALPPSAWQSIREAYAEIEKADDRRVLLQKHIRHFRTEAQRLKIPGLLDASGPIQGIVIAGNKNVRAVSSLAQEEGFDVRPILSPTVPRGTERLRICLHSYNTETEITGLLSFLTKQISIQSRDFSEKQE